MNNQRSKPAQLLTELEREPVVYAGCTWTEISRQLYHSTLIGFFIALALGVGLWVLGLIFPVIFVISSFTMFIWAFIFTRSGLKKIAKNRIGKPLFYEKHINIYKSNRFVQPQRIVFQRERNHANKK